jgi:hypothetical protein
MGQKEMLQWPLTAAAAFAAFVWTIGTWVSYVEFIIWIGCLLRFVFATPRQKWWLDDDGSYRGFVQIQNPVSKQWVLVSRQTGRIIETSDRAWRSVPIINGGTNEVHQETSKNGTKASCSEVPNPT